MADNETDLDEDSLNDQSSEKKKISKTTIIIIASVIILLIVGGVAGYFIFATKEVPSDIENASTDNLDTDNIAVGSGEEETTPLTEQEALLEIREKALSLAEENLALKQRIMALENENKSSDVNASSSDTSAESATASESEPADDQQASDDSKPPTDATIPKIKTQRYDTNYFQDESATYPSNAEPPPEPKWGEFERLSPDK